MIFDCDGVLVDTELISNTVLAGLLTEAGLPTTLEHCMTAYRGRSIGSVLEIAEAQLGSEMPFDVAGRYYAAAAEIFARELRPVPGVIAALDRIELPSCVASSGPHHKMAVTLRTTGLWERFEGRIFSSSEVARGKPAPDLFLHAASSMGVAPARCVVVEDSAAGVEAARAAGMRSLGYAGGLTPPSWLEGPGTVVFDDMADLDRLLTSIAGPSGAGGGRSA